MSETKVSNRLDIIQMITETPPMKLSSLDFVKNKVIENYNACHGNDLGDLYYHRQMIHFNQAIAASEYLQKCDRFSLYAVFATAAANGYDLDPAANEVYVIPKGGVARLWRQAGAHVRRLMQTNQIRHAEQVQLVYRGDNFLASKGVVMKHEQAFASEEFYVAYQEFVLPDGKSRWFIYPKSQWEGWRLKSDVPNGPNWLFNNTGLPEPGFLRTKITKHACTEKVWATGTLPIVPHKFQDVEVEADDMPVIDGPSMTIQVPTATPSTGINNGKPTPAARTPDPVPPAKKVEPAKQPEAEGEDDDF